MPVIALSRFAENENGIDSTSGIKRYFAQNPLLSKPKFAKTEFRDALAASITVIYGIVIISFTLEACFGDTTPREKCSTRGLGASEEVHAA
ncbi:MAG: hypothetical protein A3F73_04600 [Gallionellales bacterium RIFCSPLOWO2_12_FULL_59_22]|nr:MAG: hypothetical protein A3H99_07075 [Gallionellales bacterium RIFCSPLOWO2_02_FULL_59_110]OGT03574.1 MAG: hypothetical protein A2Z65_01775 [Gallionellales bacterium RIFCSPLOWO2_02_58_13]OGT14261.1 MAG: hypothetical protein A3F73_04600 [Gallionellales bacterium RIFCSPLOWO2_12_FULL_59_22]